MNCCGTGKPWIGNAKGVAVVFGALISTDFVGPQMTIGVARPLAVFKRQFRRNLLSADLRLFQSPCISYRQRIIIS